MTHTQCIGTHNMYIYYCAYIHCVVIVCKYSVHVFVVLDLLHSIKQSLFGGSATGQPLMKHGRCTIFHTISVTLYDLQVVVAQLKYEANHPPARNKALFLQKQQHFKQMCSLCRRDYYTYSKHRYISNAMYNALLLYLAKSCFTTFFSYY